MGWYLQKELEQTASNVQNETDVTEVPATSALTAIENSDTSSPYWTGSSFDFSTLKIGDVVDININLDITFVLPSALFEITLVPGYGNSIVMGRSLFALAGSNRFSGVATFMITHVDMITNPCQLLASADKLGTLVADNFLIRVTRY